MCVLLKSLHFSSYAAGKFTCLRTDFFGIENLQSLFLSEWQMTVNNATKSINRYEHNMRYWRMLNYLYLGKAIS